MAAARAVAERGAAQSPGDLPGWPSDLSDVVSWAPFPSTTVPGRTL